MTTVVACGDSVVRVVNIAGSMPGWKPAEMRLASTDGSIVRLGLERAETQHAAAMVAIEKRIAIESGYTTFLM